MKRSMPASLAQVKAPIAPPGADLAPMDDFMQRCALNFPDHRSMLESLSK
jgi:hypothetical protein